MFAQAHIIPICDTVKLRGGGGGRSVTFQAICKCPFSNEVSLAQIHTKATDKMVGQDAIYVLLPNADRYLVISHATCPFNLLPIL
jgi:hypothetical protein